MYENFNKKSIGNEEDELKNELELKQKDTSKKTKEKLINRTIGNRAIEKVNEQIENKKSNLLPPPPFNGGNSTKNKTKRRRTKNNTRKMKQKRRTIKKI